MMATIEWTDEDRNSRLYLESDSSDNEGSSSEFLLDSNSPYEPTIQNNVKCYDSKNAKAIIIKRGLSIYLAGVCNMQVLQGVVHAYGYEFNPGDTIYELFSMRGWPQIELSCSFERAQNIDISGPLRRHGFNEGVIKEICNGTSWDSAVICCLPYNKIFLRYVQKCVSTALLPTLYNGFQLDITEYQTEQVLKIGHGWKDLLQYQRKNHKIVLCGGKGVGKSILLRFMVNRFLMFHEKVCVIDVDPGQSEFTMPGCISIVIVDKPIFGPNFTHQRETIRSISENIDVSDTPEHYIRAVQELYKSYSEIEEIPTLVNTMGFIKGLGLEIISSIIAIINPDVVIEIKASKSQRDYPKPLVRDTILQNCSSLVPIHDGTLNYEPIFICTSNDEAITGFKPPGHMCRDIATISYFGNILDGSLTLRSGFIPMYKIHLDSVTILNNEYKPIAPRDKGSAVNANIVALCSEADSFEIYDCYGYGIVRSIINNELYLITPVKDSIHKVTHLIIGMVQFPAVMLNDGMPYDKGIPYFSKGCLADFTTVPRRSFLPRK